MRIATILAAIAGLAIGVLILAHFSFGAVLGALAAIGWGGFGIIVLYRLAAFLPLGTAWWAIAPPPPRPRPLAFVWGRMVRESGGAVLPLSQLGGFVMGARALSLTGVSGLIAGATTVVDITVELFAKFGYTILGLALLAQLHPHASVIFPTAIGLAAGTVAVLGFVLVQRRGAAWLERFSQRLAVRWLPEAAQQAKPVAALIDTIYARRKALFIAFGLHFLGWVADGFESWIALHLMGDPLTVPAVLSIESLVYAIRSLAFAIPNALGVQEAVYVMLGGLFGLPPQAALALSLLKRARDIAIGVPVLLAWQAAEGGVLYRRRVPGGKRAR